MGTGRHTCILINSVLQETRKQRLWGTCILFRSWVLFPCRSLELFEGKKGFDTFTWDALSMAISTSDNRENGPEDSGCFWNKRKIELPEPKNQNSSVVGLSLGKTVAPHSL